VSDCPDDAHVHGPHVLLMHRCWVVMLDQRLVATCVDEQAAHRVAELLTAHGIVPVPDRIPDDLVWGPPAGGALIDFRLPIDPTTKETTQP
jgi:hypothetical protein